VTTTVVKIPDELTLTPRAIVAGFPGPALLLDSGGHVLAANQPGAELADGVRLGKTPRIGEIAREAAAHGRPAQGDIEIMRGDDPTTLDIIALPLSHRTTMFVLVLARESTLERNFINALVSSRQLFKDLVSCSSDFAWETKADGTFAFVSNRGALGHGARELFGRSPANMRVAPPDGSEPGPFPFDSREPLNDIEVWLEDALGEPACLLTSCVPVFDEQRVWLGARGVCRDVTEARKRDSALRRLRDREHLIGEIVNAIRTEVEPGEIFDAAVRSTATTLRATHCWVVRRFSDGRFTRPLRYAGPGGEPSSDLSESVAAQLGGAADDVFVRLSDTTWHVLTGLARHHNLMKGAICAARAEGDQPWDDEDRALMVGVSDHLGIAIAQIESRERLEELSRTDELTKLFNRRAFTEEVERRLHALARSKRRAALFYVDLDNFKKVNDIRGHQQGDEALKALAAMLVRTSRAGDIVARLGGDEFAMWLEETDMPSAQAKADLLLGESRVLRPYSGSDDFPLGISIGVAMTDPASDEKFEALVHRADETMYHSKRGGKGRWVISPGPGLPTVERARREHA